MTDHPNKLLEKPKAVWFCNLIEQAAYITNDDTEVMFEPSMPGIYIQGSIKPIIDVTKPYFITSVDPNNLIRDYTTILTLKHDILDSEGDVVIKGVDLVRRKHLYTLQPKLPVAAINIAYNLIIDYLFKYCKYARGVKQTVIEQFIRAEYRDKYDRDFLEGMLEDVLDQLHEFIRCDDWNIYFNRLHGTTLIIEKHIDWRIYRYTEMMYEKEEEDKGPDWY